MIGSKAAVNFSALLFFHHPGRAGAERLKKEKRKKGNEKEIDADPLPPSLFVGQPSHFLLTGASDTD